MTHNNKIKRFLICCSLLLVMSCSKDGTVLIDTGAEITRPVSFATDITPIFTGSCSISGCHSSGGKSPDLTSANAFNSLSFGNFIDKANPESSLLYQWMAGKKGTPMPLSGINKDYNALVLAWIKQGAQNN